MIGKRERGENILVILEGEVKRWRIVIWGGRSLDKGFMGKKKFTCDVDVSCIENEDMGTEREILRGV